MQQLHKSTTFSFSSVFNLITPDKQIQWDTSLHIYVSDLFTKSMRQTGISMLWLAHSQKMANSTPSSFISFPSLFFAVLAKVRLIPCLDSRNRENQPFFPSSFSLLPSTILPTQSSLEDKILLKTFYLLSSGKGLQDKIQSLQ